MYQLYYLIDSCLYLLQYNFPHIHLYQMYKNIYLFLRDNYLCYILGPAVVNNANQSVRDAHRKYRHYHRDCREEVSLYKSFHYKCIHKYIHHYSDFLSLYGLISQFYHCPKYKNPYLYNFRP